MLELALNNAISTYPDIVVDSTRSRQEIKQSQKGYNLQYKLASGATKAVSVTKSDLKPD